MMLAWGGARATATPSVVYTWPKTQMTFAVGRPYSGYPADNVRLLYPSTGKAPPL